MTTKMVRQSRSTADTTYIMVRLHEDNRRLQGTQERSSVLVGPEESLPTGEQTTYGKFWNHMGSTANS